MLNLKEYIQKYDYFKIYRQQEKSCNCYCFWPYGYCKHSLFLQKDALKGEEEALDEVIMLDKLGKKKLHSRPKFNLNASHTQ